MKKIKSFLLYFYTKFKKILNQQKNAKAFGGNYFKFLTFFEMRTIKDVFVNGISLVSKGKTPAVEQAENTFALFKTKKDFSKDFEEIKKNFRKNDIAKIKLNLK